MDISTSYLGLKLAHPFVAGADGLVLFNRFYQPDIDIKTSTVLSRADLSTSAELLLRVRWIAILYGRVRPSLALTGGVETPADGIKALLAGADVVQMMSALLRHGPAYVMTMRRELEHWMERNGISRLNEMRGKLSLQTTGSVGVRARALHQGVAQLGSLEEVGA